MLLRFEKKKKEKKELLDCYNDRVATMTQEVAQLDQWADFDVSTVGCTQVFS